MDMWESSWILDPYHQYRKMQMDTKIPLNIVKLIKRKRGRRYDAPFFEACPHLIQYKHDLQAP